MAPLIKILKLGVAAGDNPTFPSFLILRERSRDDIGWMKVKVLTNLRIINTTPHQEKRTLQRSTRNNHSFGLDMHLPLHPLTVSRGYIPSRSSTSPLSHHPRYRLPIISKHRVLRPETFQELGPGVRRGWEPRSRWPVLLACGTTQRATAAVVLLVPCVLRDGASFPA